MGVVLLTANAQLSQLSLIILPLNATMHYVSCARRQHILQPYRSDRQGQQRCCYVVVLGSFGWFQ
jgi:hypothetical protein